MQLWSISHAYKTLTCGKPVMIVSTFHYFMTELDPSLSLYISNPAQPRPNRSAYPNGPSHPNQHCV